MMDNTPSPTTPIDLKYGETAVASGSGEPEGKNTPKGARRLWQDARYLSKKQPLLVARCLVAAGAIVASALFVRFVDGKTNSSSPVFKHISPTTWLNVISVVYTICLSAVLSTATDISWWRTAVRGTNTQHLNDIWDRGNSGVLGFYKSFVRYPINIRGSREASTLAVIAFAATMTNLLGGPLLQQALDVGIQDKVTNRSMKVDIPVRIPDGWTGTVDITKPGNISFSHGLLSVMQQWYRNEPITMTKLEYDYLCPGVCTGDVPGAGIIWNCTSTTDTLILDDLYRNGSLAFATAFDRFQNQWGNPALQVVTRYVTSVNNSCGATVAIDTCNISMSTIKYPVIIQNRTMTLNMSRLHQVSSNWTYQSIKSNGDSNSTKIGWGTGPLAALEGFANAYYLSNATVNFNGTTRLYDVDMNGMLARLYYDTNDTHYDAISSCAHQFSSPTYDILSALHEVTFRIALKSNNGTTANFTAEEIDKEPFYRIRRLPWISALTIMSLVLLIMLAPIMGYPRTPRESSSKTHNIKEEKEPSNETEDSFDFTNIKGDISTSPMVVARAFLVPPGSGQGFMRTFKPDPHYNDFISDHQMAQYGYHRSDDTSGKTTKTETMGTTTKRTNGL